MQLVARKFEEEKILAIAGIVTSALRTYRNRASVAANASICWNGSCGDVLDEGSFVKASEDTDRGVSGPSTKVCVDT